MAPSDKNPGDRAVPAEFCEFLHYPPRRDEAPFASSQSTEGWIRSREETDGAGGLWRIHDTLYDLSSFTTLHPGGSFWIESTRGTDITESVETSHPRLSRGALLRMLAIYEVGPATTPRNSPFTFASGGFYRTIADACQPIARGIPRGVSSRSAFLTDCLAATALGASVLFSVLIGKGAHTSVRAAIHDSAVVKTAVAAGSALALLGIATHNAFHAADSAPGAWRRYFFDLSLSSSAEWRVSHAMSHHNFANTEYDLEMSMPEPLMSFGLTRPKVLGSPADEAVRAGWSPTASESGVGAIVRYLGRRVAGAVARFVPIVTLPVTLSLVQPLEGIKRIVHILTGKKRLRTENFLPIAHFGLLALVAGWVSPSNSRDSLAGIRSRVVSLASACWLHAPALLVTGGIMHCVSSGLFTLIGFTAAHHHPELFHFGDFPRAGSGGSDNTERQTLDWGLAQLDTLADRREICGSLPLTLVTFGDHTLHHLFPTIDHAYLPLLRPEMERVCREFGVPYQKSYILRNAFGALRQLLRVEPRHNGWASRAGAGKAGH